MDQMLNRPCSAMTVTWHLATTSGRPYGSALIRSLEQPYCRKVDFDCSHQSQLCFVGVGRPLDMDQDADQDADDDDNDDDGPISPIMWSKPGPTSSDLNPEAPHSGTLLPPCRKSIVDQIID